MVVRLTIRRFDPEKDKAHHWEDYGVDVDPHERVLDALNAVKGRLDGSLAYRRSCSHGICGSDAMEINGLNRLACKYLVCDAGQHIRIAPLPGFPVIKDLIVDLRPFFVHYRAILPYLINDEQPPTGERLQSPEERRVIDDTSRCILCASCTSACPSFWGNKEYLGPAAIVAAHRFLFDSRDRGSHERLDELNARNGVWRCRTIMNCTKACPREIKIVEAIAQVKRALLLER